MEKINIQIKCIEREIGMRERVYPNWVRANKMTKEKADAEIQAMRDVLKTLKFIEPLYYSLVAEKGE